MCNACGFLCCGYDGFSGCGCDGCPEPECWSEDDDFYDGDEDEGYEFGSLPSRPFTVCRPFPDPIADGRLG